MPTYIAPTRQHDLDNADHTDPIRQHDLDHADQTALTRRHDLDHADQVSVYSETSRSRNSDPICLLCESLAVEVFQPGHIQLPLGKTIYRSRSPCRPGICPEMYTS